MNLVSNLNTPNYPLDPTTIPITTNQTQPGNTSIHNILNKNTLNLDTNMQNSNQDINTINPQFKQNNINNLYIDYQNELRLQQLQQMSQLSSISTPIVNNDNMIQNININRNINSNSNLNIGNPSMLGLINNNSHLINPNLGIEDFNMIQGISEANLGNTGEKVKAKPISKRNSLRVQKDYLEVDNLKKTQSHSNSNSNDSKNSNENFKIPKNFSEFAKIKRKDSVSSVHSMKSDRDGEQQIKLNNKNDPGKDGEIFENSGNVFDIKSGKVSR